MARQPSLFLVFVHYELQRQTNPQQTRRSFLDEMRYLQKILQPESASPSQRGCTNWQGIGFVFLEDGLIDALRDRADLQGGEVLSRAQGWVEAANLDRVRIVGAPRLRELIARLRQALPREAGQHLDVWFAGGPGKLCYDDPKVIEAFIRIANIGRHVPLFRFDDDVLFFGNRAPGLTDEQRDEERARFRQNILHLCRHYRNLSDDPEISHFIFSGGYLDLDRSDRYKTEDLQGPASEDEEVELLNGFATRLLPLATRPSGWGSFHQAGLASTKAELRLEPVCSFLRGLYEFGANPFLLVISGAGLCLSDSAILDLPPFSNMRQNVVWIDDHLKYALHHELRHFGYDPETSQVARLAGAVFPQMRDPPGTRLRGEPKLSNVQWHLRKYLPWLLMGCAADAWLRGDKRLKRKVKELDRKAVEFKQLIDDHVPGVYAKEFQDAVLKGVVAKEGEFKEKLWRLAVKRICEVVRWWQDPAFQNTFLGLFAMDVVRGEPSARSEQEAAVRLGFLPSIATQGLAEAAEELIEEVQVPQTDDVPPAVFAEGGRTWRVKPFPKDLSTDAGTPLPSEPTLPQSLVALIDDFVGYIKLASLWRHAVFAVRTLLSRKERYAELDWLIPEPFPEGDELLPGSLGIHEQLTAQNAQRFVRALNPERRDVDLLLRLYAMRQIEMWPETLTAQQKEEAQGFLRTRNELLTEGPLQEQIRATLRALGDD